MPVDSDQLKIYEPHLRDGFEGVHWRVMKTVQHRDGKRFVDSEIISRQALSRPTTSEVCQLTALERWEESFLKARSCKDKCAGINAEPPTSRYQ